MPGPGWHSSGRLPHWWRPHGPASATRPSLRRLRSRPRDRLVRAALDPTGGHGAEVAAHRAVGVRGLLRVVPGTTKGEIPVEGRPGRAGVAVERHSNRARVDQLGAFWARPPELLVAVAEGDRAVAHPREHPRLVFLRLGREALD